MPTTEDPNVLHLHCLECARNKHSDKISVIMLDGESLHIICDNHSEPMHVFSFTIPESERPTGQCEVNSRCRQDSLSRQS